MAERTGSFFWTQEPWGRGLRCAPLAALSAHVFTTRDLDLRSSGAGEAVVQSLARGTCRLLWLRQVHGRTVAVVRRGRLDAWTPPEADAIVSDHPDVALGVHVADCVPILLADRRGRAVGAAHAGWRGTAAGVAAETVAALRREFACDPADLVAAIGPSIGRCCYEVGVELLAAFDAGHAAGSRRWFERDGEGRLRLDLWRATRDQLLEAGLPVHHIHVAGLCTASDLDRFHSFRAEGHGAGRLAGVIRLARPAGD